MTARRIAPKQDRPHTVIFKLTKEEHEDLRRIAHHLRLSVSHTCRTLIQERAASLWPNKDEAPNVHELNMMKEQRVVAAVKKTADWIQRSRNAFQKKEHKLRKEVALAKKKLQKEREEVAQVKLKEMEDIRADKRAASRKMYREIEAKKLRARKMEKESVRDVELALSKESARLGRALTESEKWTIGNQVRSSVGSEEDLKIESAVARAVLDKERKLKRKLTERERWEVRDAVRNR